MTLKQLTYFLKIAELGNLTKAAQALNISQPPLSYSLKQLETELGVQLFIRDSHNLKITSEGAYLQDKASQILTLVQSTEENLKNFSAIAPITINIGAVSSVVHNMLPGIINTYRQNYPSVVLNIHDGSSIRIMELLDNGIIDIGIFREPFNRNLYCYKKIGLPQLSSKENDYFVAAGKRSFFTNTESSEIKLVDLAKLPLIIHRRFEDSFLHDCTMQNVTPHIICRNDNITTSIEWSENGFGVAVMPLSSSYLIHDKEILIKKITDPVSYSNIYLIWNKSRRLPLSVMEFISLF